MPTLVSHGTERSREFSNERAFRNVIGWLNEKEDDPGRRRIRQLLRNVQIVTSNWALVEDQEGGYWEQRGDRRIFSRAHNEILHLLRRYKFSPLIVAFGPGVIRHWTPVSGPDGRFKRRWPPCDGKTDDVQAVYELTWPIRPGLERVKECNCGKWFFARFAHQKFCSGRCREKAHKSTPEWKEYRREKAREYYWLHKNKNTK